MPSRRPIADLLRYAMATAGSVAAAGAQFALSLVLLRLLAPAEFGRISFLLVVLQLSWGVWSALFCAPLPTLLARADAARREAVLGAVVSANLLATAAAGVLFLLIGLALGQSALGSALFAAYGAVSLLRWFGRAYGYATAAARRTIASDLIYGGALLVATALLWAANLADPVLAYAALLASAAAGLVPLGRGFLRRHLAASLAAAGAYRAVWSDHARWSLLGVLTTEATANAHVYLVTLLMGPAAFAPISASTLVARPVTVAMNALSDYERAGMARAIADGEADRAMAAVRLFRGALIAAWVATAIGVVLVFRLAPRLLFPPRYDLGFLVTATGLWMAVTAVRLLRTPDSVLLQAAGAFRPLAMASLWSAVLSIAAVLALLLMAGPLWSIAGILAGEMAFAVAIWRRARDWRAAD